MSTKCALKARLVLLNLLMSLFPTSATPVGAAASSTSTSISSSLVRGDLESAATPAASDSSATSNDGEQSTTPIDTSFVPSWESTNVTCDQWLLMDPSDQWSSVNANSALQTFREMYLENQLLCQECYGMSKNMCSSSDPACDQGLEDLSMSGNISRWDQAMGVFAQTQTDLNCDIEDSSQCSQAPECSSEHGPTGIALLKSMTTMHNSLSNIYMALDRAHSYASDEMEQFTAVFAPVKSLKNKAIFMDIMFVVAGVLAGLIPGVGWAAAAGLLVGVGAAFVMNTLIFDQPSAPDTSTVLAQIVSNAQGAYSAIASALFADGSYVYSPGDGSQQSATITWSALMANGKLLQQQDNQTDALEQVYERLLYQQLAVYTWENLEEGSTGHMPFIAFENGPCNKNNSTDKKSDAKSPLDSVIDNVSKSDTNVTYNGTCYYLLDGTTKTHLLLEHSCIGKALPGGTNKDMNDYSGEFAQLSISDFVIPSVKGWQDHNRQNGWKDNTGTGQIFTDPQDAGTVSFPVCDYLGNPDSPGVGCPKFGKANHTSCYFYDQSYGLNQPGDFNPGWCGVHVEQWRPQSDENQLSTYQLSATIKDDFGRPIGNAIKQSAAETLELIDSVLPYDLYIATGASDDAPLKFWYSGQYWNSSSKANQCSVGDYNDGYRQMDCGFHCTKPTDGENPPASATIQYPFPNAPTAASGGNTTFLNTYITRPTANASVASPAVIATTTAAGD